METVGTVSTNLFKKLEERFNNLKDKLTEAQNTLEGGIVPQPDYPVTDEGYVHYCPGCGERTGITDTRNEIVWHSSCWEKKGKYHVPRRKP